MSPWQLAHAKPENVVRLARWLGAQGIILGKVSNTLPLEMRLVISVAAACSRHRLEETEDASCKILKK